MDESRRLIVNADDFGMSRSVNRGIVEAHVRGIVTAASLMPNLPAAEHALELAAASPRLDLGLHLTLTAGRPLSPPVKVQPLVDAEGRLLGLLPLLARLAGDSGARDAIRRELTAQLEWAERRGMKPSHLDSHHHIHTHPAVSDIVLDLARQAGASWVRVPTEGVLAGLRAGAGARHLARAATILPFAALLAGRGGWGGLRTVDRFRGIGLGFGFSTRQLWRTLVRLPAGLTELMVHPGYVDRDLRKVDWLGEERVRELRALTHARTRALVARVGLHLTTFRDALVY